MDKATRARGHIHARPYPEPRLASFLPEQERREPNRNPVAIALAWGLIEAGLTIWDIYETGTTLMDPCASLGDKVLSGGSMAMSAAGPGPKSLYEGLGKAGKKVLGAGKKASPTKPPSDAAISASSASARKSVRSLRERLAEHREKLEAYRRDPDAFDNKDFLRNAPSEEIRQQIIDGRIGHLEKEISNFENQIEELTRGL